MIKSGISHSLMSLFLLAYSKELLKAAERVMGWLTHTMQGVAPENLLHWLTIPHAQIGLLIIAAFCWGILHHMYCHPEVKGAL